MGFLESEPDLSGTVFTPENLKFSKCFLRNLIEKHDPKWLRTSAGPLASYWNSEETHSATVLIELARILSVSQARISQESAPFFNVKIPGLLRPRCDKVYEENLTEFQVASMLADRASPIALEPLVPRDAVSSPRKPKSPDFAIRLPDADIFLEVTVFRFGALDTWDREIAAFAADLSRMLEARGLRRECSIKFPLEFRRGEMLDGLRLQLVNAMNAHSHGRWVTELRHGPASIEWQPLPVLHFDSVEELDQHTGAALEELDQHIGAAVVATSNVVVGHAFAFAYHPVLSDLSTSELFVRSVRNTFKLKRKQFPHRAPYILVVKLGHHRLLEEGFLDTLETRIWPSADFAWMSAICVFVPQTSFESGNAFPRLCLCENPNARIPVTPKLRAMFEGTELFHLHS